MNVNASNVAVENNEAASRVEWRVDEQSAVLEYELIANDVRA